MYGMYTLEKYIATFSFRTVHVYINAVSRLVFNITVHNTVTGDKIVIYHIYNPDSKGTTRDVIY